MAATYALTYVSVTLLWDVPSRSRTFTLNASGGVCSLMSMVPLLSVSARTTYRAGTAVLSFANVKYESQTL